MNARTALLGLFVALTIVFASTTLYESTSKTTITSTSTQTETSTTTLQPPVMPSVYEWVYHLQSRDSNSLASMYALGANLTWTGDITGLSPVVGTYEGRGHIEILYGSWLGNDTALSANITNYSQETIGPGVENVTFSLTMVGNSPVLGGFKIAANVAQSWNYVGGQWQVLKEDWNFTTYNIQFPG
jgi:hypothetical protein